MPPLLSLTAAPALLPDAMDRLSICRSLRYLLLADNGLRRVPRLKLPQLWHLDLSNCHVATLDGLEVRVCVCRLWPRCSLPCDPHPPEGALPKSDPGAPLRFRCLQHARSSRTPRPARPLAASGPWHWLEIRSSGQS